MARIVIDAREYTTSTGRYLFRLIQYLEKLPVEHEFVLLHKPRDMEAYTLSNPRFTKVACPFKEFTFAEQTGFLRQVRSLKADLVHFGKTEQPVLYSGRSVTTVHDLINALYFNPSRYRHPLYFKFKQLVYRWVIRRVAKKSRAIITPTHFIKDQLVDFTHTNSDKVVVTYESADVITDKAVPVAGVKNKQFIMYVGRPTRHKNLHSLIDAFAQLQADYPDLCLVLAGKKDANYTAIEEGVKDRGLRNVIFTGFISDGQLRWLYEHCAAYIFPSLMEGFGLPGLEAMKHSAPVVASNATCIPEVLGDAAHYFDPRNIQDMAAKIAEVLDDESLRQELIKKGGERVKEFSWQRMAEQTLAVYEQVLSET